MFGCRRLHAAPGRQQIMSCGMLARTYQAEVNWLWTAATENMLSLIHGAKRTKCKNCLTGVVLILICTELLWSIPSTDTTKLKYTLNCEFCSVDPIIKKILKPDESRMWWGRMVLMRGLNTPSSDVSHYIWFTDHIIWLCYIIIDLVTTDGTFSSLNWK